jgi:hypothetical protein
MPSWATSPRPVGPPGTGHTTPIGQGRPEGQGDRLPDLEDGHDAGGQIGVRLENKASKGQSGRVIPMNEELRTALVEYCKTVYLPDSASWSRAGGQRGFPRKPWSTCSGAGSSTSALTAARVTPDVALS